MKEIFKLLRLTWTQKNRFILALVFILFVAFFTYVFVELIQPIIDEMFVKGPNGGLESGEVTSLFFKYLNVSQEELLWIIPVLLVVVIFGKGLFTFLSSYFMKSIGLKIVKKMRDDLFEQILYQSSSYFDRISTGELLSRVTNDVDRIREAVAGNMGDFLRELFILIALLAYVFVRDWQMALTAFIVAPLAIIPLSVFSKYLRKKGRQNQERVARIFRLLHEAITGHKVVKAFTMERFEHKKFLEATQRHLKTGLKLGLIGSLSSPFMEFMGGALAAFILTVGAHRISRGYISPGEFGSFVMAIFLMYMPIKRISRANNVIQHGVVCYQRVREILDSSPQIREKPNAYPLPKVKGEVKFDHVSFCYSDSQPVLHDINFTVKPKETVALVGLSGGGKTTIVNLISRFYDPTMGKILVDGIDIKDVTLLSLRSQIGLVTQEIVLFNDTVFNNIAYGLKEIPIKRIIKVAKAAKAHDFIHNLPEGYDSEIGEKGALLSSGQQQRLAIARALLKNPPILILDEATSALDSKSEKLIQAALANVMKDRTTFVIAHRLSTIRNAHKIMVIDEGRIAQFGNHRELLRREGIYKKLHDLQFPEKKEETE